MRARAGNAECGQEFANAASAGRIAVYFVGVAWLAKMSDSWSSHEGVCGSESSPHHEIFLLISVSLDPCINKIYSLAY